jgi:nitroimidazol reductase NimA-like FMN-containing flavoprotein (pyridoxamine 5'-phosphate oxidase superfamily)
MLDELRERIATYLAEHQVCVLSTAGSEDAWAMPVHYRSHGLEIDCLLPRWADVAYHLEQDPRVMLVILDTRKTSEVLPPALRWLQVRGTARPVEEPDWETLLPEETRTSVPPDKLYLVVRVAPERIDLLDESRGWGVRETLDLGWRAEEQGS